MPWMSIPIALAITGAGAAGAQVYGIRSAGKQNKRAMEATERSDTKAAELESQRLTEERRALDEQLKFQREESARRERFYNEAVQRDRERWQDYLRINEPHWRQGSGVLGSLYDIAGFTGGAPAFAPPTQPGPMSGSGMPGPSEMSGPSEIPPVGRGFGGNPVAGMYATDAAEWRAHEGGPGGGFGLPTGRGQSLSRVRRSAVPTMPTPSSRMPSLTDLMQLATAAGSGSKALLPSSRLPISALMTAQAL